MRILLATIIILTCGHSYSQCCTAGKNLVINGNFEDTSFSTNVPPKGFTTDNKWFFGPSSPSYYTIIKSRNYGACNDSPQTDKTTGKGFFLWYDIDNARNLDSNIAIAWQTEFEYSNGKKVNSISVRKNCKYVFSCFIRDLAREADCTNGGAPIMGLRINNKLLTVIDLAQYTTPCCPGWVQLCAEWNSENDTIANIFIESRSNVGFTDLGIDDVYFGLVNCADKILKLANIFTPNGDGKNDEWRVIYDGYKKIEIEIFNRWGTKVFNTAFPNGNNWNGKVNNLNTDCPEATYFYKLLAVDFEDNKTNYSGLIQLIR